MISVYQKGNFDYCLNFLKRVQNRNSDIYGQLRPLAIRGVSALEKNTPKDSGKTSDSWDYEIVMDNNRVSIFWLNNNVIDGTNIAILLQYGHATGTGGYVYGYDYINPAIKPIFDEIENEVWNNFTKK